MTLKEYLDRHNINRLNFANIMGVSERLVYAWCARTRRPGFKKVEKILNITDNQVTIKELDVVS